MLLAEGRQLGVALVDGSLEFLARRLDGCRGLDLLGLGLLELLHELQLGFLQIRLPAPQRLHLVLHVGQMLGHRDRARGEQLPVALCPRAHARDIVLSPRDGPAQIGGPGLGEDLPLALMLQLALELDGPGTFGERRARCAARSMAASTACSSSSFSWS